MASFCMTVVKLHEPWCYTISIFCSFPAIITCIVTKNFILKFYTKLMQKPHSFMLALLIDYLPVPMTDA